MNPVTEVRGIVAPLPRDDVDTDQIIPKQFLKRVERTGYGAFLFNDWRYADDGDPDEAFVLNRAPWSGAKVLVAGDNFGCGSSREHAVWALADFGIAAVVAPSFADIFRSNCFQVGLVPVELPRRAVDHLLEMAARPEGIEVVVDVSSRTITGPDFAEAFPLDDFRRRCLLEGLDDIGLTLEHESEITAFERRLGT